jgi:hypothetical protein
MSIIFAILGLVATAVLLVAALALLAVTILIVAAVLNFLARVLAGSRRDVPAPG